MWEMVTGSGAAAEQAPPVLDGAATTITLKVNGVSYTVPTRSRDEAGGLPAQRGVVWHRVEDRMRRRWCGACTVLLHMVDPVSGKPTTKHINSCLRPLCSCDGLEVSTVESVGSQESGLHPIQKQLADNNGSLAWLLHARLGDGHDGTAREEPQAFAPGGRGPLRRQHLPLHRV